jgi:hypothetical protein
VLVVVYCRFCPFAGEKPLQSGTPLIWFALMDPVPVGAKLAPVPTSMAAVVLVALASAENGMAEQAKVMVVPV